MDGGPIKALTRTESRFSRVTMLLVRGSTVLLMYCSSQIMFAPEALNTSFAAAAISGPTPSPGNSVAWMGPLEKHALQEVLATAELAGLATLARAPSRDVAPCRNMVPAGLATHSVKV